MKGNMLKKTLEVICINDSNTIKLIKNQKYDATGLFEEKWYGNKGPKIVHKGKTVFKRKIFVKGIGAYSVDRFKCSNGENFYDIPLFRTIYGRRNVLNKDTDYTGQFILCVNDSNSKYLRKGEIYLVEKHKKMISF